MIYPVIIHKIFHILIVQILVVTCLNITTTRDEYGQRGASSKKVSNLPFLLENYFKIHDFYLKIFQNSPFLPENFSKFVIST